MGNYASRLLTVSNSAMNSVYRGRKRKCIEEDDYESESQFIEKTMQTPKRRKLLTTAQYIYKTLFQEEKGSDVTVLMLGKAWRLHKVYISQSPYFASMFSGSWREANEKLVSVEIADPNITLDSLTVVLGSFYQDEISLEPKDVISILATATLFQLQGLIDQCSEIMTETTNIKTVVPYYSAAVSYGVPKVKNVCKRWLEVNIMGHGSVHPSLLKEISPDLMAELVASPDLVALQTEFCIYMMLRACPLRGLLDDAYPWHIVIASGDFAPEDVCKSSRRNVVHGLNNVNYLMYLTLNIDYFNQYNNGGLFVHIQKKDETVDLDEFFRNHHWTESFLATKEGKQFSAPFRALRKKYLLLNNQDVQVLENDNLIPEDWLHESYKEQWLHILRIDANKDTGPTHLSKEDFSRECFRCARCVDGPGEHVWRWTAFHFGLDLIVTLDFTTLRFKRLNRLDSEHIKANHNKHNIILKVSLISLNEQRQIKYFQDSGQIRLSLHKNEEKQVMSLDKELTYPLLVSVNLQVVTPLVVREEKKVTNVTVLANT